MRGKINITGIQSSFH